MWRPYWPIVPFAQGVAPIGTCVKNGTVGVAVGPQAAAVSAATTSIAARAIAVAPGPESVADGAASSRESRRTNARHGLRDHVAPTG